MRAIFKREMRAYFASPVGYVVVAALLALRGRRPALSFTR